MSDTIIEKIAGKIKEDFLESENDYIVLVFGAEGEGKSNFAFHLAKHVDPDFDINNVVFSKKQWRKAANNFDPESAIVADEGVNIISSLDVHSKEQKRIIKKVTKMRAHRFLHIYCLSTPELLDKRYFVKHRMQERGVSVVRVPKRGRFYWYGRNNGAVQQIRKMILSRSKDFSWSDISVSPKSSSFPDYEAHHEEFSQAYRDKKFKYENVDMEEEEDAAPDLDKKTMIKWVLINSYSTRDDLTYQKIARVFDTKEHYIKKIARELRTDGVRTFSRGTNNKLNGADNKKNNKVTS